MTDEINKILTRITAILGETNSAMIKLANAADESKLVELDALHAMFFLSQAGLGIDDLIKSLPLVEDMVLNYGGSIEAAADDVSDQVTSGLLL